MFKIIKREELEPLILSQTLSEKAEFFMDGETTVPEMLAFIFGAENNLIDLDEHLTFYPATLESLSFCRFSGGQHALLKNYNSEEEPRSQVT